MSTIKAILAALFIFLALGFAGEDDYQQAVKTEAVKAQYLAEINGE